MNNPVNAMVESLENFRSELFDLPMNRNIYQAIRDLLILDSRLEALAFRPEAKDKIDDFLFLIRICLAEVNWLRDVEAENLAKQAKSIIRKYHGGIYAEQNLMPHKRETRLLACSATETRLLCEMHNLIFRLSHTISKGLL